MINSNGQNLNVYVGDDEKIHFTDWSGADSVLNFSSGISIEYLGEGTSFDVSNYSGYQNFTVDNFIIELSPKATLSITTASAAVDHNYSSGNYAVGYSTTKIIKTYDNATGKLSAYISQTARVALYYGSAKSKSASQIVKCYLII